MKKIICLVILTAIHFGMFAQQIHSNLLKPITTFGKSMAMGLSVSSSNRVFISFPNYDGDGKYALTEEKEGKITPYPNKEWNTKGPYTTHFLRVKDLYVDAHDNLWVLDSKPADKKFKLVKINTKTNTVEKVYELDDLDKAASSLNDVRVDVTKNLAYLSDPGQAAIIILNLKTGKSRTVLKATPFTNAAPIVITYQGQKMIDKNGNPFSSNVNGIALTKDFKYFYFKPINKTHLFRIATQYLSDVTLSEPALESKVENMGEVGITHGLVTDVKGNIFLTNSTDYSIRYLSPDGKIHTLVKDYRLLWPDSLGIGSDGYLYFTCSQVQRLPKWNGGKDRTEYPYTLYKVKLP